MGGDRAWGSPSLNSFLCFGKTGDLQSGNGLLRRIPPIGIEEKIVAASYPALVEYKVREVN